MQDYRKRLREEAKKDPAITLIGRITWPIIWASLIFAVSILGVFALCVSTATETIDSDLGYTLISVTATIASASLLSLFLIDRDVPDSRLDTKSRYSMTRTQT